MYQIKRLPYVQKKGELFHLVNFKNFHKNMHFSIKMKNIFHQHFYSINTLVTTIIVIGIIIFNKMCYKKEYMYILGSNKFPGSHYWFRNSICWRFVVFQSLDIPSQLSTKFFHIRINWVILIGTTCKRKQTVKLRKFEMEMKIVNCKVVFDTYTK